MLRHLYYRLKTTFKKTWQLSYDGEFSYELIAILPFVYWLYRNGHQVSIDSSVDTKCFYYFIDTHKEVFTHRRYTLPSKVPIKNIHVRWLNTNMWTPPPLKERYKNNRFVYPKPLLIITNKFNSEWGHNPLTFLSLDFLKQLFNTFQNDYQIIYCRPSADEIIEDNSEIFKFKDKEMIKDTFKNILLIEELSKMNPDLTFNECQCMVFANAHKFISLLGGYSLLCSYFKGTNIIYAKKSKIEQAREIGYKAFDRWYHKFSGSKIIYCDTYEKILSSANKEFLAKKTTCCN